MNIVERNGENHTDDVLQWYVMTHLEPSLIDLQLQKENEKRFQQGLPAMLYIIPFRYMVKANAEPNGKLAENTTRQSEAIENNDLRDYMHDFVFVKASEAEIVGLVNQKWNREGRLHLRHYRTKSGVPIKVSQQEMQPLLTFFIEQRQRFSFAPYSSELAVNEKVFIKTGVFKNHEAVVLQVHHSAQGISLMLGVPMFNKEVMMKLYDYPVAEVEMHGNVKHLAHPHFVEVVERDLLDILRRRVLRRNTDQSRSQDQEKLNFYSILNYLKFEDIPTHRHLRALMLLCAALRRDKQATNALTPLVSQMMQYPAHALDNDEDAFLLAVLFVATKNVDYCRAAREYCRTHDIDSQSLKAIMPLIKKMPLR